MSEAKSNGPVKRLEPCGGWYIVMYRDRRSGSIRYRGFDAIKGRTSGGMHLAEALVTKRAVEDEGVSEWACVMQIAGAMTDDEELQTIAAAFDDDFAAHVALERERAYFEAHDDYHAEDQANKAELRMDTLRCSDEAEMRQATSLAHLRAASDEATNATSMERWTSRSGG